MYDYALVHAVWTIPLALLLTLVSWPLLTRLDVIKTLTLIGIAFTATLPWDSYLVRHGVWTYPPQAILGPSLFSVPIEELFFFIIQTYITSILYIVLSKPVLHCQYLTSKEECPVTTKWCKIFVQSILLACIAVGAYLIRKGGEGTYLGLILVWACPFALLNWSFSGLFLLRLPMGCIALSIILPTVYLWIVDELALGRGTWAIESGTKLGWCLWGSLEMEEAIFFLATNTLIVSGLVAFDRSLAVLNAFPGLFPSAPAVPPARLLLKALLTDPAEYDMGRIRAIKEAVSTLKRKSRSFYLASAVFPGRLRLDLIFLYAFCRVADDLIDNSQSTATAEEWIGKLNCYLDTVYPTSPSLPSDPKLQTVVERQFPPKVRFAFKLLPVQLLPRQPLYDLLAGFRMDVAFIDASTKGKEPFLPEDYPIRNEQDLELYASRVASTVGVLCLHLAFHHSSTKVSADSRARLIQAARTMGLALQYINIARDLSIDAAMDRVYIPTTWLKEEFETPQDFIVLFRPHIVEKVRQRLLDLAFSKYRESRLIMDELPHDVRAPFVVAIESYMDIGRVLKEKRVPTWRQPRRATVPRVRRLWVAWKVLATN